MGEKAFFKTNVAMRGERNYNYLGKTVRVCLNYNKNNRIPISPIRMSGGSEKRAIVLCSRPDSSPPCRMLPISIACIGLDEADLDHDQAVEGPNAPWLRRERPPACDRRGTIVRCECRTSRSQKDASSCADGSIRLGEE